MVLGGRDESQGVWSKSKGTRPLSKSCSENSEAYLVRLVLKEGKDRKQSRTSKQEIDAQQQSKVATPLRRLELPTSSSVVRSRELTTLED